MAVIDVSHVYHSFGGFPVLRDVGVVAHPRHRIGVVGDNGAGKTTLLQCIAGRIYPDSGDILRPDDLGYLDQDFPYHPSTQAVQVVTDALATARALVQAVESAGARLAAAKSPEELLKAQHTYMAALHRAEQADAWNAPERAATTMAGLGVSHERLATRSIGQISGGERSRLGLAAILIRQPSALLLDEPTNHLDDRAVDFLTKALQRHPAAILIVSHDQIFLDEVCTHILDLDPVMEDINGHPLAGPIGAHQVQGQGATLYRGTFSEYRSAQAVERIRWQQRFTQEQEELRSLRQSVTVTAHRVGHHRLARDKNVLSYKKHGERVQGQVSSRVRAAQRRLDELEQHQVRRPPAPLQFTFNGPPRMSDLEEGQPIVAAHNVQVAHRLRSIGVLSVVKGDHLLITGGNGCGKSTMLGVLAGDIVPTSGTVWRYHAARSAFLEQDADLSHLEQTPHQLLAMATGDIEKTPSYGLITARDLHRPVGQLSTGQRRRVLLAMLLCQQPDVLFLDEPTNHISVALVDEFMDAIHHWPGTVVMASHDRWIRQEWRGVVVPLEAMSG